MLANSSTASLACLAQLLLVGLDQWKLNFESARLASFLNCIIIGHYACCNGDTWASELGILSTGNPILITTGRRVPKGTNGGISLFGTGASIIAGFSIGIVYFLGSLPFAIGNASSTQLWIIPLATLAGALGSIIDSLMGATLQYSAVDAKTGLVNSHPTPGDKHITGMHLVNNHMVNYLSSVLTAFITAWIGSLIF